jgi:hypothetical protein
VVTPRSIFLDKPFLRREVENMPNFKAITAELNRKAHAHQIGKLQNIRAELHQRRFTGQDIFRSATTFKNGAFHYGGRRELQFNIWLEDDKVRHGVGFFFQQGKSLQNPIEVLKPKVDRFNDFMRLYPRLYADMRMWHYKEGKRSANYIPRPIPDNHIVKEGSVFLGKLQHVGRFNYEAVLDDFDKLLRLYKFIEDVNVDKRQTVSVSIPIKSRRGFLPKALSAIRRQLQKQHQIDLRQNKLQKTLRRQLVLQYGVNNVTPEFPAVHGRVDVAVHQGKVYWFYEIKTADSSRECLRQALGQLLEYAFWPGAPEVTRLIIVGEHAIDKECENYLKFLKKHFLLPVEYRRIVVN